MALPLIINPEAEDDLAKAYRWYEDRRHVVCYTLEVECVKVVAVFHGHRDPRGWKSRAP